MSASLFYGDCLQVMAGLPDKSVDCFICDLPYGCLSVKRGGKRKGKLKDPNNPNSNIVVVNKPCSWDVPLNLDAFWAQVKRLRKSDSTPCLMFCTTKFGIDLINSNPKEFRYDLVWNKSNAVGFLSANIKPMSSHEMIYVFSKSGAYYKRINIKGDFPAGGGGRSTVNFMPIADMPNTGTTIAGERCPTSVISIANKKRKGGHPTEKSEALYRFLIERYCPADGTMLDPTAGSFNSVFTALEMGRDAIGIEKDEGFFLKAKARAMAYQA
jgi:site-specific DNA-methyltransferase (adenine-specific)